VLRRSTGSVPGLSGNCESIDVIGGFDANPYVLAPLNEIGLSMCAKYDDGTENPACSCIGPGVSNVLVVPYQLAIIQNSNEVAIRHEYFDAVRTVYLDQKEHPDEGTELSIFGHSIG